MKIATRSLLFVWTMMTALFGAGTNTLSATGRQPVVPLSNPGGETQSSVEVEKVYVVFKMINIGEARGLNYSTRIPDVAGGIHFNLSNNLWGTNFSMWNEDSITYRFVIEKN